MTTAPSDTARRSRVGCYGFALDGVPGARPLLVDAPEHWPGLALHRGDKDGRRPARDIVEADRSVLPLQRGWVEILREPTRATFRLEERPPDGDLVHPYLAPVAAVAARWAGRESFHAGAVIAGGGAWAVLGDKENGKSTTLAWLALHGHPVLVDDLLVLDGATALAGPRCIDLREEAAARLGAGEPLGMVGLRERWRLALDPVAATVPLRGWIALGWADELSIERLRGPERMLALLPYRAVALEPGTPEQLIELASLPVLRLRRPQRWDSLAEAGARLLDAIAA
jgi:hypothetical protein